MNTYRCTTHNTVVAVDGNKRTYNFGHFPGNITFRASCALLTAQVIQAGNMPLVTPAGEVTNIHCVIEEV